MSKIPKKTGGRFPTFPALLLAKKCLNLFQESSAQLFSALELTFSIDLSAEEGGGSAELVPGGRDLEVNAANVYSYVRKYSHYRSVFVTTTY